MDGVPQNRSAEDRVLGLLRIAALVLAVLASVPAFATEPVDALPAVAEPQDKPPFLLRWIERDRVQLLRERIMQTERLAPHLKWLAEALWRESARPGFSVDVDPDDEEVIVRYRIKF